MITRGTTPTHTFTAPFEIPAGSEIRIVYSQNKQVILEIPTDRCIITGNVIQTRLTDEETLLFDCQLHYTNGKNQPHPIEIQVGLKIIDGNDITKLWSDIIDTTVGRCLREDGVI